MDTATGTARLERVDRAASVDEIVAIVNRDGGVIIEGLLDADTVATFNREIDAPLADLKPGGSDPDAVYFFGANTKRLTNMVVVSETFRETILQDALILAIADQMMHAVADSYWLTASQVIEIGPGNAVQPLHRDMANYPIFMPYGPESPEVAINFLIATTDFTDENGATRVIPGSNA